MPDARCPGPAHKHADRRPSLSVTRADDDRALLHCFLPGCETTDVLDALGLELRDLFPRVARGADGRPGPGVERRAPTWTPPDARRTWLLAHRRARDDARIAADHRAYRYLTSRGLAAAWEESAFGLLHPELEPHLPPAVRWWPRAGYRVVVPLFDQVGELVEVQARSIDPRASRKTLYPKGGSGRGRVFASRGARELLVGCGAASVVLLGEGLTDYLALVITSSVPVIAVAGVGAAVSAIGKWVCGRHVVIALDCDSAGERAAQDVADAVYATGGECSRLEWPNGHKDACEVLVALGEEHFVRLLEKTMEEARAWTRNGNGC